MKTKLFSTLGAAALTLTFLTCDAWKTTAINAVATNPVDKTIAETGKTVNSSSPVTAGDVVKIDEAGIMMIVPKGFKFSKDGDDTIVQTEDEGVEIRFTVPKDNDYEKVVSQAAQEIDDYLTDVKIEEKGKKADINGMEGTSMSGSAKDEDGEVVMWNLTIIKAPKKPVLVNIYAEQASLEKHAVELKAFLSSVKKQ